MAPRVLFCCQVNLNQAPQLLVPQKHLYGQLLEGQSMPKKTASEVTAQRMQLQKAAKHRNVLVVLDDLWDISHSESACVAVIAPASHADTHSLKKGAAFDCIDDTTRSKLLISTRIKHLLPNSTEVGLTLLSLAESVEVVRTLLYFNFPRGVITKWH